MAGSLLVAVQAGLDNGPGLIEASGHLGSDDEKGLKSPQRRWGAERRQAIGLESSREGPIPI
jgi:hypothetical protein